MSRTIATMLLAAVLGSASAASAAQIEVTYRVVGGSFNLDVQNSPVISGEWVVRYSGGQTSAGGTLAAGPVTFLRMSITLLSAVTVFGQPTFGFTVPGPIPGIGFGGQVAGWFGPFSQPGRTGVMNGTQPGGVLTMPTLFASGSYLLSMFTMTPVTWNASLGGQEVNRTMVPESSTAPLLLGGVLAAAALALRRTRR